MSELIVLNILIGNRTYRIKSTPAEEEIIRKTLKTVNEKIIEFKTQYAGKDMQDYVAMVLIWYATQIASITHPAIGNEAEEALLKIEQQLDKVL